MASTSSWIQHLRRHLREMKIAYLVLLIALVPTVITSCKLHNAVRAREQARFEQRVGESRANVEQGITRCVDQLYNIRALFAASDTVESDEWRRYLESMTVRHSDLGIRSLGYLEEVRPETIERFRVERVAAGQPGFGIIPDGPRAVYYPCVYLTHFDSTAEVIIGLDHGVQPQRVEAIEEAIRVNRPILTRKANFIGRDGVHATHGVFVYLPVEQVRGQGRGLVYMTISMGVLPAILFEDPAGREIDVEVYDGPQVRSEDLLYVSGSVGAKGEAGFRPALTREMTVPVLNREWTIRYFSTRGFEARTPHYLPWLALAGGSMLSVLLFTIVAVQARARQRAESGAAKLQRSESALAAEKERLAVTLYSIADGVITTDGQGWILSINKAAERLTGWRQADAVGRPLTEVFRVVHEYTREPRNNPVETALQTGVTVDLDSHSLLIDRQGAERAIIDSSAPVRDGGGRIIGAVLVFRDMTEKRKTEAEMLRESKLESVGLLAGGIAHDFNNILTGIIGNISLARMSAHSTEKMLERLMGVERSAIRARDLTQQLLTFAKGGSPIRRPTLLPQLVKDSCQFALHGSNVECEYSLPPETWPVAIDEGQFRQIVNHLIINAMQAMPEGGRIEVKLKNVELTPGFLPPLSAGQYVKLAIRDYGVGIRPEHLPRIFEPYFTTKKGGNGLGLATAYSVVRKHDGQFRVESTVGLGTTFNIYLPAAIEAPAPTHDPDQREFFGQGRLLLMDDEHELLEVAGEMLRTFGYEVETAKDGAEAVEKYLAAKNRGQPFTAVIMDLTVPNGMGGREAIGRLKEVDPDVKAIVSSGYSFDPVMANYRQYGFCGIMPKPYRAEDLARVLDEVLGESKAPAR